MTLIYIACGLALALGAGGCGYGGNETSERESVVASFYPLAFAAEALGGSGVDVKNLTPPGAEPHDLELTPGDLQSIGAAGLVLLLGHDFQPQLEQAAGDGDRVLRLLDTPGLDLLGNDLPLDTYARYIARINAVTAADVQRVARQYIDPEHFAIVVVGDRSQIEAGIRALNEGPISIRDLWGQEVP